MKRKIVNILAAIGLASLLIQIACLTLALWVNIYGDPAPPPAPVATAPTAEAESTAGAPPPTAAALPIYVAADAQPAVECAGEEIRLVAGVADDFDPANGPEFAWQNETLVAFLREKSGITKSLRHFDETESNHVFNHTFTELIPGGSRICSALLEIRVRPDGGDNPANDSLALGFAVAARGQPFAWRRFYGSASGKDEPGLLDSNWSPGRPATTLILNLAALPLADGSGLDLVEWINEYGFLDVFTNDDTAVDYILLTVQYAPR